MSNNFLFGVRHLGRLERTEDRMAVLSFPTSTIGVEGQVMVVVGGGGRGAGRGRGPAVSKPLPLAGAPVNILEISLT